MIYPAQTSLIPVQVALARFLETSGFAAALGNYPYWYLGTTPFRYLTGPILPLVLVGLHKVLSFLSLFEIMLGLVGVVWVVGGIGVYLLVKSLNSAEQNTEKHGIAVLAALFYLLGPMVPFLFRFADGLYLIAFSFLPYVFWLYCLFLQPQKRESGQKRRNEILLCLLITFIILLDSLIIPSLLLGMAGIFLAEVGWKKTEEKLKRSLWLMAYGLLLATIWYTPGYWLTLLGAPSLGGAGVLGVIGWLGKLLPTVLALVMAVFSIKFFKKRNSLRDFCFYWLFIFGFLSLLRFLSDPDFWLDWTAYGTELQFGFAILGGLVVKRLGKLIGIMGLIGLMGIWVMITNKYVLGTLQKDITNTVEYRIGRRVSEIAKPPSTSFDKAQNKSSGQAGERVFLSGTTAFWLNAFFDLPQVRGGKDQSGVDPNWRKAAWEIREGTEIEKSIEWLRKLEVSYLVVHTEESGEFYHDFAHPEKFEEAGGLEKVYDEEGDRIYRVND